MRWQWHVYTLPPDVLSHVRRFANAAHRCGEGRGSMPRAVYDAYFAAMEACIVKVTRNPLDHSARHIGKRIHIIRPANDKD